MLEKWEIFALGSAFFAGLTALFGKMGVKVEFLRVWKVLGIPMSRENLADLRRISPPYLRIPMASSSLE